MKAILLVLACACTESREARIERGLLTRSPIPVAASLDANLVEGPEDHGFHHVLVERATGRVLAEHRASTRMVAPAFRPGGGAIAYFATDGTRRYDLRIWDFARGDQSLALPATASSLLRFSPDGHRLAYVATDASQRRMLTIVDLATRSRREIAELAYYAELEWAPNGEQLATALARSPGTLTVLDEAGTIIRETHVVDGDLRDLAWAPDGRTIAVTGRGRDEEWLRLYRVSEGIVTTESRDADVHAPRYCGDALIIHVERDGERRLYIDGVASGRGDASTHLAACDAARVVVIEYARTASPTVVTLGSASRYVQPPSQIWIGDLPAQYWPARNPAGAVVMIHGGPARHSTPTWAERTQLFVDAGFTVIKLDYRGSSGHGARFEARGTASERVDDVLAARDHAARITGLPTSSIVLFGESYGAGLVALATARDGGRSPAILVGTLPLATDDTGTRCPVVAFHGELDDLSPSAPARAFLTRLFGTRMRWSMLENEGHYIARTRSRAKIYAAILDAASSCR